MKKNIMKKVILFALSGIYLSISNQAFAKDGGDYDYSWLENDKKIYVVQNRKYEKALKFDLSLQTGLGITSPYTTAITFVPKLSFYFNEHWGINGFAGFIKNADNVTLTSLKDANPGNMPVIEQTSGFFGGTVSWIPFYAKLNMFDQLLYLDWSFSAGGGLIQNTQNIWKHGASKSQDTTKISYPAFVWGTGHKYFMTRHWSATLDLTSFLYNQKLVDSQGKATSNTALIGDYYVTLGLSYLF